MLVFLTVYAQVLAGLPDDQRAAVLAARAEGALDLQDNTAELDEVRCMNVCKETTLQLRQTWNESWLCGTTLQYRVLCFDVYVALSRGGMCHVVVCRACSVQHAC